MLGFFQKHFQARGMNTLVLAPALDDRYGVGKVASRIGLESEATTFNQDDNLFDLVQSMVAEAPLHCVLIDEAQFLTKQQVFQLSETSPDLGQLAMGDLVQLGPIGQLGADRRDRGRQSGSPFGG